MQKQYLYQLEKLGIVDNLNSKSKAFLELHHALFIKSNNDGDFHVSELFPAFNMELRNEYKSHKSYLFSLFTLTSAGKKYPSKYFPNPNIPSALRAVAL